MRRGEIWLADLEPVRGSESNKQRPVVLVSNDHANRTAESLNRGVVTAIPVTANVQGVFPFQTLIEPGASGLARQSKAQAEQIRSLSVDRLVRRLGRVDGATMRELDRAILLHLAL